MLSPFRFTSACIATLVLAAALLASGLAHADKYPDHSTDGLDRVKSKKVDALYRKEGTTLTGYKRINIEPCDVQFRKNWQRDQNRSRMSDPSGKVTDEDMERIRNALSQLFQEVFIEELAEAGYQVTTDREEDVLLLKPSIINLDVGAPDVSHHQVGRQTTYVAMAGEMTLSMDFFDALNNELIGRAIDRRVAHAPDHFQVANRITNRAEAIVILEAWAGKLVDALDEANGR